MAGERRNGWREAILSALPGLALREQVPLCDYTTLRLGGPAELFAEPDSPEALAKLLRLCREIGLPAMILGRGSNLLFRDGGCRGLIIHLGRNLAEVRVEGRLVRAQAGAALASVSQLAARSGLKGLAFACGIPGSIGGAVCMNAGAYGGEMKDVVARVRACTPGGETLELSAADCGFGYRDSRIRREGLIVTEAELLLTPGDPAEIQEEMQRLLAARSEKQPLDLPSAGSTFKRPAQGYAAQMIDECGLKGLTVGGASVSTKHAGFLVNRGGTARDFETLMRRVAEEVLRQKGVLLEPEVIVAGEAAGGPQPSE